GLPLSLSISGVGEAFACLLGPSEGWRNSTRRGDEPAPGTPRSDVLGLSRPRGRLTLGWPREETSPRRGRGGAKPPRDSPPADESSRARQRNRVSDLIRVRVEVLRRLATDLVSALGMPPSRAAAFATQLLWFDAAGASGFGIATLPRWLERIE